jgi:O-glycosyl hydrolase
MAKRRTTRLLRRLTQAELDSFLEKAADILRGNVDHSESRGYVFALLFFKRISDVYVEEVAKLTAELGDEALAKDPKMHNFVVPDDCLWDDVARKSRNQVGTALNDAMIAIERANQPKFDGILTGGIDFNDSGKLLRDKLIKLINHFSSQTFDHANVSDDVFGNAYEYLVRTFASKAGKSSGEFYTPKEVAYLLAEMVDPQPGHSVCDWASGSGGLLFQCRNYLKRQGKDPVRLRAPGARSTAFTGGSSRRAGRSSLCRGTSGASARWARRARSPGRLGPSNWAPIGTNQMTGPNTCTGVHGRWSMARNAPTRSLCRSSEPGTAAARALPALLTGMIVACLCGAAPAAEVRIDATTKHQAIFGWSVNPWSPWVTDWQRDQVLDLAVNDLGLTRCRAQAPNGNRAGQRRWEWHNDNANPYEIKWDALATATADRHIVKWIKPFKRRVEARGEKFDLWISPSFFDGGSTGSVPAWLLHSPAEYAEFATSYLLYLKKAHGIEADYHVICNEPGNNNAFKPDVVARMIRTLGPRLKELGLKTKIQFPDGVNARSSWRYIEFVGDDQRVWPYVGVLSYHLYGTTDPFRSRMRDLAIRKGIPNAQTEQMGAKFSRLYDDLTRGGVSHWSIYGWGNVIEMHHDGASFGRGRDYWPLRQVMHYVRPGAVRIGATADDPSLRALAFVRKGKTTVVLLNDAGSSKRQAVAIRGLARGRYGLCQSVNRRPFEERGVQTVGHDGTLRLDLSRGAVATVYPCPGGNGPPTVTNWSARPTFLTWPGSEVTLSASATDPERDAITFAWSVGTSPRGAKVVLVSPDMATTKATGLTAPGQYGFVLSARDRAHVVRREVRVNVFAENQPPRIHDLHNRIPVMVTLPASSTILRAWPKDLEGDPVKTRWSVVRKPAGAAVVLETIARDKSKMARRATKMTVPGEYVFRFHAADGKSEAHKDLKVTVYPPNRPPVIEAASVRPLAAGAAALSATAADADGDVITCWWSVKRAPRGARPVVAKPGLASTKATGMTAAGEYVFTVTVADRAAAASKSVNVTVGR